MGRSAGLAPLRILSTKTAARRQISKTSKHSISRSSFDDAVRPNQNRLRHREAQGTGSLEVDRQNELGWLPDWQFFSLGALEKAIYIGGGLPIVGSEVGPVGHQGAAINKG